MPLIPFPTELLSLVANISIDAEGLEHALQLRRVCRTPPPPYSPPNLTLP